LGVPGFRLLAVGQFSSTVGDYCYAVALPWLVLSDHSSAAALGVVLACYGVPRALLTVPAGSLADRLGPRRVMLMSDVARCALTAVFTVLAAAHVSSLAALAAVAAVLGACSGLFLPASMTLMPSLVDNAKLASANALYTGFVQAGSMIGPAIGGILVAAAGPAPAFAVDAGSYLVSAACLTLLGRAAAARARPAPRQPAAEPFAGNVWTLLRRERILQIVLVVSVAANFAVTGTTEVMLPALTHAHYGADGFGAVLSCVAVASIVGALVVARAGDRLARAWLIAAVFQVAAVAIAVAPFLGGLPGLTAGLAVFGLALGVDNAIWGTLIQRWAPPELLGRVWGVLMLASVGSFPLATLAAGVLTRHLGPVPVFPVAGGLLALSYLFGLSSRKFRDLGRRLLRGQLAVECGVLAPVEQQRRRAVAARLRVLDAADDDLVIPAGQRVLHRALDDGEHVLEPRTAGGPAAVLDALPGGGQAAPREVGGQVPLPFPEHVDHECPVPVDGLERRAVVVEADEHERRVERERGDRVGGRADRRAVLADGRDDGDPGGEMPHYVAELRRGYPHAFSS
jgi:MFS family permease